jgi:hypothetical protein
MLNSETEEIDPLIAAAAFTDYAVMGHAVLWVDEPLLVWFCGQMGSLLAMRTIDRDGEPYHLIAIVLNDQDLAEYLANKTDLRSLMTREDAQLYVINYNAIDAMRPNHYGIRPLGGPVTEDDLPGEDLFWYNG